MSQSRKVREGTLAVISVIVLMIAGCALPGDDSGTTTTSNNTTSSAIGWPFDAAQGGWAIENGYNTGPDHYGYELDSFDFQRSGGTTGQTVLSPISGISVDFGPAYPGDGSSGKCVSITISGHDGYHLMVCHLVDPVIGPVSRGSRLATVSGGPNGDHIHITLYYLDSTVQDTTANVAQRRAVAFTEPWIIDHCDYPADGTSNQWAATPVPCSGVSVRTPQPSPTPSPTPTRDPLAACRSIAGFASAGPADTLATSFVIQPAISQPTVPFPSGSLGFVQQTFDTPDAGAPGMVYHFELIAACSPATTAYAVRSFFAAQFPAAGWSRSDTFPYRGNFDSSCGDPYCWLWGPYAGDISRFASLEKVGQAGSAVRYTIRLGVEAPE